MTIQKLAFPLWIGNTACLVRFCQNTVILSVNLIYLSLFILLIGCTNLSKVVLDKDPTLSTRYHHNRNIRLEVEELVCPLINSGHTPSMEVGVLTEDGKELFFGFGIADKVSGKRPDEHTPFAIGSLSKGFLAEIAAVLVGKGVIKWEMTLGEIFPESTSFSDDAKRITLEELASHSSGLPRQPMDAKTGKEFLAFLFGGKNFYSHFDDNYIDRFLTTFRRPRNRLVYSNIGYGLLARAIKHKTGQSLDQLLREHLTEPLQLYRTGYSHSPLSILPGAAIGHAGDQPKFIRRGKPLNHWTFSPFMQGSAAMHSDAADLLRYARAHLFDSGATLNAAFTDAMRPRHITGKEKYALGWLHKEIQGLNIIYQIGYVGGYSSFIGLVAEPKIAVVVLQNSFNWTDHVGQRLLIRMACSENTKSES